VRFDDGRQGVVAVRAENLHQAERRLIRRPRVRGVQLVDLLTKIEFQRLRGRGQC
jgi:hypothetical protein